MPLVPRVSVPAPVMAMADWALATLMPFQDAGLVSVRSAPREVLVQVAMSPDPGAVPPQLAPSVRSVPLADLVTDAACEAVAMRQASRAANHLMGVKEWERAVISMGVEIISAGPWLLGNRFVGEALEPAVEPHRRAGQ